MSYRAGSQGSNCATPPVNSATCYTLAALTEETGELFSYTKNAAGFDASWAFNRTNKLLGGFDWEGIKRHSEETEAPNTDDYRYWIEYRNSGWQNLSGRLKYEFLQRRSDLVIPPAVTSVTHYYAAYDVNNFDANVVKLNLDWTPGAAVVRRLRRDVARPRLQGQLVWPHKDKTEQYDVTVSWGDAEKVRCHRHRQLGQGRVQPGVPGRQLSAAGTEHLRELTPGAARTPRTPGCLPRWSIGRRPTS